MPKTPEQHRQMAQLLRKAGNERLADQHDLIAFAMEQRRRSVDETAQRGIERLRTTLASTAQD